MIQFFVLACWMLTGNPPTSAPAASDPAIAEFEAKLVKMVKEHKSFSAKVTQRLDHSGAGSWDRSDGTGTIEYLIQNDKILFRADLTTDSLTTIGAEEYKTHDVHTLYWDGEFAYDVGETNGKKVGFKSKIDPMQSAVPTKSYFDALEPDYTLKLLPDEKIDGKDVWVLEIRPKDLSKAVASRMVSYFRKDAPLVVKTISYDKYNRPFQWLSLSDIKINPKLDPKRFEVRRPDGVEWVDWTK